MWKADRWARTWIETEPSAVTTRPRLRCLKVPFALYRQKAQNFRIQR